MKIVALPPPLTQAPGTAPAATPAAPFADYLDAPPPPADSARSFAELGVFGRPALAPAGKSGADPQIAAPAPLADLPAAIAPARAIAAQQAAASAGKACDPPKAAGIRPPPAPAAMAKAAARATGLPAPVAETPRPVDDPEAPAPATGWRRRATPATLRPGISLILSEKDGAVEIVAGAPVLDPEIRAALRRLAEAILARSGLRLAQFQLNGAPVRPDSITSLGGSHGTRTN